MALIEIKLFVTFQILQMIIYILLSKIQSKCILNFKIMEMIDTERHTQKITFIMENERTFFVNHRGPRK